MTPVQEFSLLAGVALLILSVILYVQDKVEQEGFRKPYSEIKEKWYHWDYLWGHLSWILGRRALTFFWQRRTRGFDDSELWALDWTFIKYMLPRLKAFRASKIHGYPAGICEDFGVPESEDGHAGMAVWLGTIDKMIWSMEHWIETEGMPGWGKARSEELERKYQEGMDLFHIYFHSLWD